MASFIKNIFSSNKKAVNDSENKEDYQSIVTQKWNKSQKSLNSLDLLFEIQDENFVLKELINSKTVFRLKDENEYSKLLKLIKLRESSFRNNKIIEIINNIKEFDTVKLLIEQKQFEVNKIVPENTMTEIADANKKNKNDIAFKQEKLVAKFDFEIKKYFFANDNFTELAYGNKKHKARIYFGYVEYLINNVLDEANIVDNCKDFHKHAINNNIKMKEFIDELINFSYSNIFDSIINKDNFFEIIYNSFIEIDNAKENSSNIDSIKKFMMLLIPNKLNFKKLIKNNFFKFELNLGFLFTNIEINALIKDKESHLDVDMLNTLLNFMLEFENYVEINEKKAENKLIINNDETSKPCFFEVYDYIFEVISDNIELKNIKNNIFFYKSDNEYNQFIFLDYLISLYKTLKNFNRNYTSIETINLENDQAIEADLENDDSSKKLSIPNRKASFANKKKYNFTKFLSSELDESINDNVLAKEIFIIQPEEINRETHILNNFIDEIFTSVFFQTQTVERFAKRNNNKQNEVLEAISNNFIYKEKIRKLPTILFLKIIQMNSPIGVLDNFIKKSVNLDIEKDKKNGFLKFIGFTILKYSFEILSDTAENYPCLIERLELVNNLYDTAKFIEDIKIKIGFLEVINNKTNVNSKKSVNENKTLTLKNIIFEEENLKSFVKHNLKICSSASGNNNNNIANIFFNNQTDLKKFKSLANIYDFILTKTNKFNSSKGIKFFKHFDKEIAAIDNYLDLIQQTVFPKELSNGKHLNIIDFILFFIKNERLEIYSLEFLKENVIFILFNLIKLLFILII